MSSTNESHPAKRMIVLVVGGALVLLEPAPEAGLGILDVDRLEAALGQRLTVHHDTGLFNAAP